MKFKVGLVGIDNPHALAHLRTLALLDEIDEIYLCDGNSSTLPKAEVASGGKFKGIFASTDQLLQNQDITVVIACLQSHLAAKVIIELLNAGRHVLAEKPLGLNSLEILSAVEASDRANRCLGVFYTNRYDPVVQETKIFVSQGLLGSLMTGDIRFLTTQVKFRNRTPNQWIFNRNHSGGGILTWLGCHYIDLLHYLTGDAITSVSAEIGTLSGEAIDVEDVASVSMRFKSGAVCSLHMGYTLALSGEGFENSGYDIYLGLNGTLGKVVWDYPNRLRAESASPKWSSAPAQQRHFSHTESPAYGGKHGEKFVRDFLAATQGLNPVPASGRDALVVQRVLDAVYESARVGRRIDVHGA